METPFALAYGFETKVPTEVFQPTRRVEEYEDERNEELLRIEKNFLEERREAADRRMVEYQQSVQHYHDARVKTRYFLLGDLVLRDRSASKPTDGGKMAVNWEGPYRIAVVVRLDTYRLESTAGEPIPRNWNSHRHKEILSVGE